MNDAARVDGAKRRDHVDGNWQRLIDAEGPALEQLAQRFAVQQLHGDEQDAAFFADLVYLADVRMVHARRGAGFAPEPPTGGLVVWEREHLFQREAPLQPLVVGLVDHAHATGAELAADRVMADPRGEPVSRIVAGGWAFAPRR